MPGETTDFNTEFSVLANELADVAQAGEKIIAQSSEDNQDSDPAGAELMKTINLTLKTPKQCKNTHTFATL